ncbi:MAG: copper oxidase [Myxococcales bacterium]|nr:copper oxidase [Myxococcales bacterium]
MKTLDRRGFVSVAGSFFGAAMLSGRALASDTPPTTEPNTDTDPAPAGHTGGAFPGGQVPVTTPNGKSLPWTKRDGVKVGHLVAEPVDHEFAPGLRGVVWGYNGGTPGPTLEAVEGDRLRIYVTNRLPEPTTVHWHGLIIPNGMDGVAGLNQRPIPPGETWVYEFTVKHPGTYMYHSHYDEMVQIALGLKGMFIVHPKRLRGPRVDRDFVMMTHEWKLDVGAKRPDPSSMNDFNLLTFNGRAFPGTEPLVVGLGERVRIRLGNLSPMDHHPIHLHGLNFVVTATDGGYVPKSAQHPDTTVLVPVGATRVIEFVTEEPGDWAMHCHMTHHVMTQMGHGLANTLAADLKKADRRMARVNRGYMSMGQNGQGGMGEMDMPIPPNSLPMKGGPGPFSYIDMGGMFTIIKVRAPGQTGEGWYPYPRGTVAGPASPERMARDGIEGH